MNSDPGALPDELVGSRLTLTRPVLCLVTDLQAAGGIDALEAIAAAAVQGGVNMLQVRAHDLFEGELTNLAHQLRTAVGQDVLVAVNESLKAAVDSNCGAVHLPEQIKAARETAQAAHEKGLLVGRSVHSVSAAKSAIHEGADYLFMGTVYPSSSHPGGPVCGVDGVRSVVDAAGDTPVIGIGGITAENAGALTAVGAAGVAVIGAIINASYPKTAAKLISNAIAVQ